MSPAAPRSWSVAQRAADEGDVPLQAGYKMALLCDLPEFLQAFLYDPDRKRRRAEPLLRPLWRTPARRFARKG
jgi:hypothetical protein